jgi:O-antigen ligase
VQPPMRFSQTRPALTLLERFWIIAIILTPFDAVTLLPYHILGFSLSISRLVIFAALALSLLAGAVEGHIQVRAGKSILGLYFMWFIWNLASGLWAVSEAGYMRYMFLSAIYSVLLIAIVHLATKRYEIVLKAVMYIIFAAMVFGIIELLSGYRLPASRQWSFRNEIVSFFVNPSHFGGALVMFAPFILMYPVWLRKLKLKDIITTLAVLGLVAYFVMRSGSRGAVLSLVLGCATSCIFCLLHPRTMKKLIGFGIALMVLAIITVTVKPMLSVPEVIIEKLASLANPEKLIASEPRSALWMAGLQLWAKSPLIGWGVGASESLLMEILLPTYSLHNWWIEVLVNTGIIGIILWVTFIIGIITNLMNRFWQSKSSYVRFVISSLLGGMVASLPLTMTVGSLMTFSLFWLHLGLCIGALSLSRDKESSTHYGRGMLNLNK